MIYNSEETNLNDFLFCTEELGERPSKMVLAFNFKSKEFNELFEDTECVNVLTEVIPADNFHVINEKYLVKINEDMYLSYTHIDKSVDTNYISNVILYYRTKGLVGIEELMMKLDTIIINEEDSEGSNTNIILNTTAGLAIEPFEILSADYDNIECYFNDSTIKRTNKLIKKINKKTKGLSIIYGERGCGKTVLLNYIATECTKTCIFIPINMIDATINNPEFFNILKTYKPVIIIDDCEILSDNVFIKSNAVTYANMLQIVEGFYSDDINTHIIMAYNTKDDEDIDSSLLEANNLLKVIKINSLKVEKANELCKHLGINHTVETSTLLIDVLNETFEEDTIHIGYN